MLAENILYKLDSVNRGKVFFYLDSMKINSLKRMDINFWSIKILHLIQPSTVRHCQQAPFEFY